MENIRDLFSQEEKKKPWSQLPKTPPAGTNAQKDASDIQKRREARCREILEHGGITFKPCPLCGWDIQVRAGIVTVSGKCANPDCGVTLGGQSTIKELARKWNRRVEKK